MLVNGTYDGGDWMRNQALEDIKRAYPGYNTDHIQLKPVDNFDPNDPLYTPVDTNPERGGMVTYLPPMRFKFEDTPEYAKQQAEAETQFIADETERNRLQSAIEWEAEKNPDQENARLNGWSKSANAKSLRLNRTTRRYGEISARCLKGY